MTAIRDDATLLAWLDEVLPLPALDDPRVVTRGEALRDVGAAAIRYRCRVGTWLRMAPSVYLVDPPATPFDRLQAAARYGGASSVLSGPAALAALGFRTIRPPRRELVLVRAESGVESWGRIQVRRTARLPGAHHRHGLPLAPVARAVADHVLSVPRLDQVQATVAEAVQRRFARSPISPASSRPVLEAAAIGSAKHCATWVTVRARCRRRRPAGCCAAP